MSGRDPGARPGDAGATEIIVFCNARRRTMECVGKSSLGGLTLYAPTLFPKGLSRERPGPGPALKAKPPRKRSSRRTARDVERWKAGRLPLSPKEQGPSTLVDRRISQAPRTAGAEGVSFRRVQAPVCDRERLTPKITTTDVSKRDRRKAFARLLFNIIQ